MNPCSQLALDKSCTLFLHGTALNNSDISSLASVLPSVNQNASHLYPPLTCQALSHPSFFPAFPTPTTISLKRDPDPKHYPRLPEMPPDALGYYSNLCLSLTELSAFVLLFR